MTSSGMQRAFIAIFALAALGAGPSYGQADSGKQDRKLKSVDVTVLSESGSATRFRDEFDSTGQRTKRSGDAVPAGREALYNYAPGSDQLRDHVVHDDQERVKERTVVTRNQEGYVVEAVRTDGRGRIIDTTFYRYEFHSPGAEPATKP